MRPADDTHLVYVYVRGAAFGAAIVFTCTIVKVLALQLRFAKLGIAKSKAIAPIVDTRLKPNFFQALIRPSANCV